jgi:hypothetical protein
MDAQHRIATTRERFSVFTIPVRCEFLLVRYFDNHRRFYMGRSANSLRFAGGHSRGRFSRSHRFCWLFGPSGLPERVKTSDRGRAGAHLIDCSGGSGCPETHCRS